MKPVQETAIQMAKSNHAATGACPGNYAAAGACPRKPKESLETHNGNETDSHLTPQFNNMSLNDNKNIGKAVQDLTLSQRTKLQENLDITIFGDPNWFLLGNEIYSENDKLKKRLKALHDCYCGGGNRGLRFLKYLETYEPTLKCEDFAIVAKGFKRNDIYNDFKDLNVCLKDLDTDQILDLSILLNVRCGKGWEYFAEKYEFTKEHIQKIKQAIKEEDVYSPTERLLEWFDSGDITLNQLDTACRKLKLKKTANDIKQFNEELSKKSTQLEY